MTDDFDPCPFCGAGETVVIENKYWTGKRNSILSVAIHHWCENNFKDGLGSDIRMRAKTRERAIARWNTRASV